MKNILCFLIVFTGITSFAAETATIEQMKNKKALIRFDDDIPFRLGQVISVTSAEKSDSGLDKGNRILFEKRNSITFSSGITSLTSKANGGTSRTSEIEFSIRYGINKEEYEYGPIFTFSNDKTGSVSVTTYNLGGFYEHNFVPNNAENDGIHGLFGDITVGSIKSGTTTVSPMTFNVGGFYKWFVLSPVLAFRFDLAYRYTKYDSTTINGIVLGAGLNHYF